MKERAIFNIRMQLAALRQMLRDQSDVLTEAEKNLLLDQIIRLNDLLIELEKK